MERLCRLVRRARPRVLLLVGLLPALVLGCGGVEQEKGLVPVSGKVTLDGGPWPQPGQITFTPTAAGKDPNAASVSYVAKFATDGSFTVANPSANGMKPGKYWVSVDCPEGGVIKMPMPGEKIEDKNAAPKKYRNPESSGFKYDIEGSKAPPANFDVKSK
jgi:hypothetical protein